MILSLLTKHAKFLFFSIFSHFTYYYLEIPITDLDKALARKVYGLEVKMFLNSFISFSLCLHSSEQANRNHPCNGSSTAWEQSPLEQLISILQTNSSSNWLADLHFCTNVLPFGDSVIKKPILFFHVFVDFSIFQCHCWTRGFGGLFVFPFSCKSKKNKQHSLELYTDHKEIHIEVEWNILSSKQLVCCLPDTVPVTLLQALVPAPFLTNKASSSQALCGRA